MGLFALFQWSKEVLREPRDERVGRDDFPAVQPPPIPVAITLDTP